MNRDRRRVVTALAGVVLAGPAWAARLLEPTPRQSAGPFYPVQLPLDNDNDLTRVQGQQRPAEGRYTDLSGRILDTSGRPLNGARIEIWQCDANGRYRHPRDRGAKATDPGFQGHGHTLADAQGRYRFRTIRPVSYPGRTPHIHVAVFPPGEPVFVTQLYVDGEDRNASDFLFNRIVADQRERVIAEFLPAAAAEVEFTARFDLVIGGGYGTPQA